MVNPFDSIRYRNVVSSKYSFHYKDMEEVMAEFTNEVLRQGATVKGPFFYSINNVPTEEILNAEIFVPIQEDDFNASEDMSFHSYYNIEDMLSYCVYKNFEKNTEVAYAILLNFIEQNNLQQVTPIFHILSGDRTMQYMFIKIGVVSHGEIGQHEKQQEKKEEMVVWK